MTRTLILLCASAEAEKKTAPRRKILPAHRLACDFSRMKQWFHILAHCAANANRHFADDSKLDAAAFLF
jgi:hypothetical protein